MRYDFRSLSYADFEDLVRDLIGRDRGVRFEAFAAGPDGGIDGRHAKGPATTILQAKHYAGSGLSNLKRVMKKEKLSIDRLAPVSYILATSCLLTPASKKEIARIIGPVLQSEANIYGPGDLNSLLRRYPDVEKSHIKLWLSGTAVLEAVLNAASRTFNVQTLEDISEKVQVYAPNPSYDEARSILETQHIVIISGPPGVGKTTLAEMLSYAHLAEGWELVALRGLEDGLIEISDARKQVFYFDDFLGRVALDKNALAKMDSDLARFITRVRKAPNARFILTTRAPIFEEARRHSEHLADKRLEISRYLLDVGVYTRRIKARILYNHMLVTGTPHQYVVALLDSGRLARIVDHKNYSPRIIAHMTDGARISDVDPSAYPEVFIKTLDRPVELWDIPFRQHLPRTCQHLLIALFFCSEFGVAIERLRQVYNPYHVMLSQHFGLAHNPKDFEESLRILEGGFVRISGFQVSFVNPSVRDYLLSYLDDWTLLTLAAKASVRTEWAQAVWSHSQRLAGRWARPVPQERVKLAHAFQDIGLAFLSLPVEIQIKESYGLVSRTDGISNADRLELLLDWWYATEDEAFLILIQRLAAVPVDGWDPMRDGEQLLAVIAKFRDNDYDGNFPNAAELADLLEAGAEHLITSGSLNSEELGKISDAFEEWSSGLGPQIRDAIEKSVLQEFRDVENVVNDIDSESTIDEHIETLQKLAERTKLPYHVLRRAVDIAEQRGTIIRERRSVASSPSIRGVDPRVADSFDDDALINLFAPLRTQAR